MVSDCAGQANLIVGDKESKFTDKKLGCLVLVLESRGMAQVDFAEVYIACFPMHGQLVDSLSGFLVVYSGLSDPVPIPPSWVKAQPGFRGPAKFPHGTVCDCWDCMGLYGTTYRPRIKENQG